MLLYGFSFEQNEPSEFCHALCDIRVLFVVSKEQFRISCCKKMNVLIKLLVAGSKIESEQAVNRLAN